MVFLVAVLAACSVLPIQQEREEGYPVLFDTRYSWQIWSTEHGERFPFDEGQLVEMKGSLTYHGVPDWVRTDVLERAVWSASLRPYGAEHSTEVLRVRLQSVNEPETTYDLDWAVDTDDVLLVVSDRMPPSELYPSPRIGDTRYVCVTLEIEAVESTRQENLDQVRIVLKPTGKTVEGFILSNVRPCDP